MNPNPTGGTSHDSSKRSTATSRYIPLDAHTAWWYGSATARDLATEKDRCYTELVTMATRLGVDCMRVMSDMNHMDRTLAALFHDDDPPTVARLHMRSSDIVASTIAQWRTIFPRGIPPTHGSTNEKKSFRPTDLAWTFPSDDLVPMISTENQQEGGGYDGGA